MIVDFLPHLPTLDISENAFDVVFAAYKEVVSQNPGYLVENGDIVSYSRLEQVFAIIGKQENDILQTREIEAIKFAKRNRRGRGRGDDEEENAEEELELDMAKLAVGSGKKASKKPEGGSAGAAKGSAGGGSSGKKASGIAVLQDDDETEEEEEEEEGGLDEEQSPPALVEAAADEGSARAPAGLTEAGAVDLPVVVGRKQKDKGGAAAPSAAFAQVIPHSDYRGRYYMEKFQWSPEMIEQSGGSIMDSLRKSYLSGLLWCLAYYTKGCVSWTWYFPFHYGPMLQDMTALDRVAATISFDLGRPFNPFQQLLGCLPPASATLLPAAYQWLMIGERSPVKEFYPETFAVDMNGKRNPWEAVVLLPFIDERRLLQAESDHCSPAAAAALGRPLVASELNRNLFGKVVKVRFSPACFDTAPCPRGYTDLGFADILNCQSEAVDSDFDIRPGVPFKPEVIPGTVCPYPGFPSLAILPIAGTMTTAVKVNVFGTASKYKSVIIQLQSAYSSFDPGSLDLTLLLGKTVYVNYPQCLEARVVSVSTANKEYRCNKDAVREGQPIDPQTATVVTKTHSESQHWRGEAGRMQTGYLSGMAIVGSGGLEIGPINVLLGVVPLQGMERDRATGARTKVFGTAEASVPVQLVLWSCPVSADPRFEESAALPLPLLLPYGVNVLVTSGHYAGQIGRVVGPHGPAGGAAPAGSSSTSAAADAKGKARKSLKKEVAAGPASGAPGAPRAYAVDVEFTLPPKEPEFGLFLAQNVQDKYMSSKDVCKKVGIPPNLLGQIVCAIFVGTADGIEHDIGLNLRRNGQYQLLGYCREVQGDGEETALARVEARAWQAQKDTIRIIGSEPDEDDAEEGGGSSKKKEAGPGGAPAERTFWEYTQRTVDLLLEYKQRFPMVFTNLASLPHSRKYAVKGLLGPNGVAVLGELEDWMKKKPFFSTPRTPLSTVSVCRDAVAAIERAADERRAAVASALAAGVQPVVAHGLPSDMLFRGDIYAPSDLPPRLYNPQPVLGFRVANVTSPSVPFGLKGTVVSIHASSGFVEVS